MQLLVAWLRSKNWTAHSIALAGVALSGLITTDQQVRDLVLSFFKAHPTVGTNLVILATIVFKYSHSSSPAGTVAKADAVMNSLNAPTATQIRAATLPQ
jgi:hypothetical protein